MKISQLYIHPIKSIAAISVNTINYTDLGPEFDRAWMVIGADGVFLSQRLLPKMCLISAKPSKDQIELTAPNMPSIVAEQTNVSLRVEIWGDVVEAVDWGDEAANWLSQFLEKPCRLVRVSDNTKRLVDTDYAQSAETVGFADGFPTLLVSQESLDEFNLQLRSQSEFEPIDMRRFRPNIVVSGCQPYAEDNWRSIRINNIEFDLVKPCSRCIMPSINPDTGAKEMQVNQTLMATRRRNRQTYFGQNALHKGVGTIHVGDSIELISG